MDFKQELNIKTKEVQDIVYEYLPVPEGYGRTVIEAAVYGMTAGGKRLRPLLMSETYRLFGGSGDVIKPFMAAIEMIHNYSLIHDDLPAMDNDMYRRGRLTTHAVYGETMGILAGDALLNLAYETASLAFDTECSERTAAALQILSKKAGIYGMVGGQTADIEAENSEISKEVLDYIHMNKTAALIEAAMTVGAVLAGASETEVKTVSDIAKRLGVAFQIQDDILDVVSTDEVLGKPVGSDEKNNKSTYVTLMGIESSKAEVIRLTDEALALYDGLGHKNDFLRTLFISLINREK